MTATDYNFYSDAVISVAYYMLTSILLLFTFWKMEVCTFMIFLVIASH